jgi:hypothetical protein
MLNWKTTTMQIIHQLFMKGNKWRHVADVFLSNLLRKYVGNYQENDHPKRI